MRKKNGKRHLRKHKKIINVKFMNEGIVLKLVNSKGGEIAIIDFPGDFIPHTGMFLTTKDGSYHWEIKGIGLPIIVEMLEGRIKSPFNSVRIWECLLQPVNQNKELFEGDVLKVVS